MIFQSVADADKLLVNFRHNFLQVVDMLRSTDTSNDVLALCVHQELTGQDLFTGGGVTGKRNASTGIVVLVTKCHHLDVNQRYPRNKEYRCHDGKRLHGGCPSCGNSLDSTDPAVLWGQTGSLRRFCFVLSFELFSQFFESSAVSSTSWVTPLSAFILSISCSKYFLPTSITTSEYIWINLL